MRPSSGIWRLYGFKVSGTYLALLALPGGSSIRILCTKISRLRSMDLFEISFTQNNIFERVPFEIILASMGA
jgi:hypothetical protein